MSHAMHFNFTPLQEAHLKQMFIWLNMPSVSVWYGQGEGFQQYENVLAKYLPRTRPESKIRAFIIRCHSQDIGYIQSYKICDYPEYNRSVGADEHAVGIDLFIGETAFLHRGYGSHVIRQFLHEVVFRIPGIDTCIIGPEPKNTSAIHAYEKAGFSYWKTIQLQDEFEMEYLMKILKERNH
ncbi:GNAT family N-acetyltransferase [Gynuella sp.]|uniref:GNAT family N-acetyltransferase n=1 Tax=Gynuella sp. TaxID=2969146 RepID=UPI003D11A40F